MEKCQNNPPRSAVRGEYVGQIVEQRSFGSEHMSVVIELVGAGAEAFSQARAGQFVQIACREGGIETISAPARHHFRQITLLRRPFSIAGLQIGPNSSTPAKAIEKDDEVLVHLEIIYQVVGPGTNWLAQRGSGEKINLLGPLGNGFTPPRDRKSKILLVGGGVGLPPLYLLAGQLARAEYENVIGFGGAQKGNLFAGEVNTDEYQGAEPLKPQMVITQFARSGVSSIAATDDGSFGYEGSVVEALEQFIEAQNDWGGAYLYACGPYGMLKGIAETAQRRNMGCQVCMEAYMACGMGVCQSCVVGVRDSQTKTETGADNRKYKLVCSDGPVFDSEMILWD